jgi:hypothetical protein
MNQGGTIYLQGIDTAGKWSFRFAVIDRHLLHAINCRYRHSKQRAKHKYRPQAK